MSEVEDGLVVAQDGGLGEEVFGENIVGEDFIRQLSGNSKASLRDFKTFRGNLVFFFGAVSIALQEVFFFWATFRAKINASE